MEAHLTSIQIRPLLSWRKLKYLDMKDPDLVGERTRPPSAVGFSSRLRTIKISLDSDGSFDLFKDLILASRRHLTSLDVFAYMLDTDMSNFEDVVFPAMYPVACRLTTFLYSGVGKFDPLMGLVKRMLALEGLDLGMTLFYGEPSPLLDVLPLLPTLHRLKLKLTDESLKRNAAKFSSYIARAPGLSGSS